MAIIRLVQAAMAVIIGILVQKGIQATAIHPDEMFQFVVVTLLVMIYWGVSYDK